MQFYRGGKITTVIYQRSKYDNSKLLFRFFIQLQVDFLQMGMGMTQNLFTDQECKYITADVKLSHSISLTFDRFDHQIGKRSSEVSLLTLKEFRLINQIKVNLIARIPLVLETKFGDDPQKNYNYIIYDLQQIRFQNLGGMF